ncbi:MAG: SIS domain-containing protein [Nitrospirae bacterium]|nr:SIS domain-containing protein [Nitrospirota bacterium]
MIKRSESIHTFVAGYFEYLHELSKRLDTNAIAFFVMELEAASEKGSAVFFAGNGGSAAIASHMANDLGIGCRRAFRKPIRAVSLTDNNSTMTAVANDFGYENLFLEQLKTLYRPGDKLVVISASGNSANVLNAAKWVKEQGGTVIGLTGFDGGKLRSICDISIHVETSKGEYGPVEDIHMILDHLIYTWFKVKAGA